MKCGFNEAYIGHCINNSPCQVHKDILCNICKTKAIKECSVDLELNHFKCTIPICSSESCNKKHLYVHKKR